MILNWSYSPDMLNLGHNQQLFCPKWPWNLTDDLEKLYALHHFIAIAEFKLELQSGNAQIGEEKNVISVTLTFDL